MSDQAKFINTYLDVVLSTVHENLNSLFQLKTQLKIANDLVSEKDQIIESLQRESSENKANADSVKAADERVRQMEENFNAMKNKVAHMDTLTAQYNEFKSNLIAKSDECNTLKTQLDEFKTILNEKDNEIVDLKNQIQDLEKKLPKSPVPKKAINNKDVKKSVSIETTPPQDNDDF